MAGTAERALALKLIADVGNLDKGLKKADSRLARSARAAASWGKAFTGALIIGGVEKLVDSLGDAWAGFRSGQQAAALLQTTFKNLGLSNDEYQKSLDAVIASTLKLGTSDDEAVGVYNRLVQSTGDATQANKEFALAQDVSAARGISLEAASKLVHKALDGSKLAMDKLGITANTASGRMKQLNNRFDGAAEKKANLDPLGVFFNGLNEDLEGIVGSLATGDIDGALAALAGMGDTLSKAWDGIAPAITNALDGLTGGKFSEGVEVIRKFADEVLPKVWGALAATGPFFTALGLAFNNVITFLQPVIDILVGATTTSFKAALDIIKGVMDTVAALLKGDFSGAWTAIQTTIGDVIDDVVEGINGIVPALTAIIEGVGTEAVKIGQALTDGIVNIAKGIPDALVGFVRDGLNSIIDLWNGFGVHLPEIVLFEGFGRRDTFGPIDLELPDIPRLATGAIVTRPTLAMIGEGRHKEAVIPLDGKHGMGGNDITLNISVNAPVAADGARVGADIMRYVDQALGRGYRFRNGAALTGG